MQSWEHIHPAEMPVLPGAWSTGMADPSSRHNSLDCEKQGGLSTLGMGCMGTAKPSAQISARAGSPTAEGPRQCSTSSSSAQL